MTCLKGHLLIARPYMTDPNFSKTVVLVFEHSEEGAAGVVINRPTDATISGISEQAFEEPLEWDKPIGLGGPVPGPLIALHQREDLADQEILPGLYSTADATKLIVLARDQIEPTRFVANYAGWGPGQLESELEEASWLTSPAKPEQVFCDDITELWKDVMRAVKRDQLASMVDLPDAPPDPRLN
jgi:putative transcriptional regulator